jgi:hypothetical protein
LKSEFRFWIIPSLVIRASDAFDLPMMEYRLELFCDGAPVGATMMIRRPSSVEFQQMIPLILG